MEPERKPPAATVKLTAAAILREEAVAKRSLAVSSAQDASDAARVVRERAESAAAQAAVVKERREEAHRAEEALAQARAEVRCAPRGRGPIAVRCSRAHSCARVLRNGAAAPRAHARLHAACPRAARPHSARALRAPWRTRLGRLRAAHAPDAHAWRTRPCRLRA
jgi:hypothetical protein